MVMNLFYRFYNADIMEDITILCIFGGSWESSSNGRECYQNGRNQILLVDESVTHQGFVAQIAADLDINLDEYNIRMRTVLPNFHHPIALTEEGVPSMYISDLDTDRDVSRFLKWCKRMSHSGHVEVIPIYITLDCKMTVGTTVPALNDGFTTDRTPFISSRGSNPISSTFPSNTEPMVPLSTPLPMYVDTIYRNERPPPIEPRTRYTWDTTDDHLNLADDELGTNFGFSGNLPIRDEEPPTIPNTNEETPIIPSAPIVNDRRQHDPLQVLPPVPSSSTVQFDSFSVSDSGEIVVGKLYADKQSIRRELGVLAMRKNFQFRITRSTTDRFEARCLVQDCQWRIRATTGSQGGFFSIRHFEQDHTCQIIELPQGHRQAGRRIIGELIKSKFDDPSRIYTPKNIMADIRSEFGLTISYDKAWHAREVALKLMTGDPEQSYQLLTSYCFMLERNNPGTVTHIAKDGEDNFLYFFMALAPCINGFKAYIRPVIAIDGTFLKGAYRGTLFVAACMDGNEQIFPLAWGIGDSENDASWEWFLAKLCSAIGAVQQLVFISDRNTSIEKGIRNIFPNAQHGACMYHVSCNLQSKFKLKSARSDKIMAAYFRAAKAYRIGEFNEVMDNLKLERPLVAKYLEEDVGVQRWSRAHFTGQRYNIMTTNIAETLNGVLRHARSLPVTSLVEFIRSMLQRWFFERRTAAVACETTLTPWAHKKVTDAMVKSQKMIVRPIDHDCFDVLDGHRGGVVNLNTCTCSCREFDLDRLPCAHALAAASHVHYDATKLYHGYYTSAALAAAYAEPIYPVGHQSDWAVPDDVRSVKMKPPLQRTMSGRRKTQRIPSNGEQVIKKRCSRCQQLGHNRHTCRNPIVRQDS